MQAARAGIAGRLHKCFLDIFYRTAWYICHRIREALQTPHAKLRGVVEADETYIGGNPRHPMMNGFAAMFMPIPSRAHGLCSKGPSLGRIIRFPSSIWIDTLMNSSFASTTGIILIFFGTR
jgi:hypothetical protein